MPWLDLTASYDCGTTQSSEPNMVYKRRGIRVFRSSPWVPDGCYDCGGTEYQNQIWFISMGGYLTCGSIVSSWRLAMIAEKRSNRNQIPFLSMGGYVIYGSIVSSWRLVMIARKQSIRTRYGFQAWGNAWFLGPL